eukprot:1763036-Ditylum_brightwellii.AAC.3
MAVKFILALRSQESRVQGHPDAPSSNESGTVVQVGFSDVSQYSMLASGLGCRLLSLRKMQLVITKKLLLIPIYYL